MAKKTVKMTEETAEKVTPEDIKGIILLSIEEARKFPRKILSCGDCWWLRDPGDSPRHVACVSCEGIIFEHAGNVEDEWMGVRPALILNLDSSSLKNGDIIKVFNKDWYYQDGLALLMSTKLAQKPFRIDWKAKNANNYQNSDIKKYLDNWLEQAKEENKMKKSTKKSNECEVTKVARIKVKFMRYQNVVLVETLSLPDQFREMTLPDILGRSNRPLIMVGKYSIVLNNVIDRDSEQCCLSTERGQVLRCQSIEEAEELIKKFSVMIHYLNNLCELELTGQITETEAEEVETASFDAVVIAQ